MGESRDSIQIEQINQSRAAGTMLRRTHEHSAQVPGQSEVAILSCAKGSIHAGYNDP